MNEKEKAELGAQTFQNFCHQFGESIHAHVLLEELFEGLIHAEALFIFGEQEQTGNQVINDTPGDGGGELRSGQSFGIQPTPSVGETDHPPYP